MPTIEVALWRGKPVNEDMSKHELIQIIETLGKQVRQLEESLARTRKMLAESRYR